MLFEATLYALGSQVEGLDALAAPDSHGGDEWNRAQTIAHCTLATAAGLFCAQQPDLSIATGLLRPLMRLATSRTGKKTSSVCLGCLPSQLRVQHADLPCVRCGQAPVQPGRVLYAAVWHSR